MRIRHLAIGTVALVGVLAFAHDSWELTGTAKAEDGATPMLDTAPGPVKSVAGTLDAFQATRLPDGRTDVEWRTSAADHRVFRLYREQDGQRVRIFPVLNRESSVSGSEQSKASASAGQSYTWWDREAPRDGEVSYWLEDANAKGQRRWHGPLVLVARDRRQ